MLREYNGGVQGATTTFSGMLQSGLESLWIQISMVSFGLIMVKGLDQLLLKINLLY